MSDLRLQPPSDAIDSPPPPICVGGGEGGRDVLADPPKADVSHPPSAFHREGPIKCVAFPESSHLRGTAADRHPRRRLRLHEAFVEKLLMRGIGVCV